MFEAFKADQLDFRAENIARRWANEYNFPAVTGRSCHCSRRIAIDVDFGEHPWLRLQHATAAICRHPRPRGPDPRLSLRGRSIADLFYGLYTRLDSFFDGYRASRPTVLPTGRELEILEGLRDKVPPEVFTADFTHPVNDTDEAAPRQPPPGDRSPPRSRLELPRQHHGQCATGEPFTIEYLNDAAELETMALRYQAELAKIGIDFQIRTVDTRAIRRTAPRPRTMT